MSYFFSSSKTKELKKSISELSSNFYISLKLMCQVIFQQTILTHSTVSLKLQDKYSTDPYIVKDILDMPKFANDYFNSESSTQLIKQCLIGREGKTTLAELVEKKINVIKTIGNLKKQTVYDVLKNNELKEIYEVFALLEFRNIVLSDTFQNQFSSQFKQKLDNYRLKEVSESDVFIDSLLGESNQVNMRIAMLEKIKNKRMEVENFLIFKPFCLYRFFSVFLFFSKIDALELMIMLYDANAIARFFKNELKQISITDSYLMSLAFQLAMYSGCVIILDIIEYTFASTLISSIVGYCAIPLLVLLFRDFFLYSSVVKQNKNITQKHLIFVYLQDIQKKAVLPTFAEILKSLTFAVITCPKDKYKYTVILTIPFIRSGWLQDPIISEFKKSYLIPFTGRVISYIFITFKQIFYLPKYCYVICCKILVKRHTVYACMELSNSLVDLYTQVKENVRNRNILTVTFVKTYLKNHIYDYIFGLLWSFVFFSVVNLGLHAYSFSKLGDTNNFELGKINTNLISEEIAKGKFMNGLMRLMFFLNPYNIVSGIFGFILVKAIVFPLQQLALIAKPKTNIFEDKTLLESTIKELKDKNFLENFQNKSSFKFLIYIGQNCFFNPKFIQFVVKNTLKQLFWLFIMANSDREYFLSRKSEIFQQHSISCNLSALIPICIYIVYKIGTPSLMKEYQLSLPCNIHNLVQHTVRFEWPYLLAFTTQSQLNKYSLLCQTSRHYFDTIAHMIFVSIFQPLDRLVHPLEYILNFIGAVTYKYPSSANEEIRIKSQFLIPIFVLIEKTRNFAITITISVCNFVKQLRDIQLTLIWDLTKQTLTSKLVKSYFRKYTEIMLYIFLSDMTNNLLKSNMDNNVIKTILNSQLEKLSGTSITYNLDEE